MPDATFLKISGAKLELIYLIVQNAVDESTE